MSDAGRPRPDADFPNPGRYEKRQKSGEALKWAKALFASLIIGCFVFILVRALIHPDRWEQSCLDRGGRIDSMHVTFEGGRQPAEDWQVCVVNEQPQETRQV